MIVVVVVRGELVVIDPLSGQKIFSVVALKRRLGMLPEEEAPLRSMQPAEEEEAERPSKRDHLAEVPLVLERTARRTRTVVNYGLTS